MTEFLYSEFAPLKKRLFRLGLALNYGIDGAGVSYALEQGVNYFFYTHFRSGKTLPVLKRALAQKRESICIGTGATTSFLGSSVRGDVESLLRQLNTDYLDVFHLFWVGVTSRFTEKHLEEMQKLKNEGKIRALAMSIHDRKRAAEIASQGALDALMIRYNAHHPGAERDLFPVLAERRKADPSSTPRVIAYTATSWGKLLTQKSAMSAQPGAARDPITAGDCYRFCLTNPYIDLVLTGPKTKDELSQNILALSKGPLSSEEDSRIREFGKTLG